MHSSAIADSELIGVIVPETQISYSAKRVAKAFSLSVTDAFSITVYDENGTEIDQSAIGNRYLSQCCEYSSSTSLYNFRARYYNPEAARWLSKDAVGISGGLNQYVAFGNNPVNFIDPFEFITDEEFGRLGQEVGCFKSTSQKVMDAWLR